MGITPGGFGLNAFSKYKLPVINPVAAPSVAPATDLNTSLGAVKTPTSPTAPPIKPTSSFDPMGALTGANGPVPSGGGVPGLWKPPIPGVPANPTSPEGPVMPANVNPKTDYGSVKPWLDPGSTNGVDITPGSGPINPIPTPVDFGNGIGIGENPPIGPMGTMTDADQKAMFDYMNSGLKEDLGAAKPPEVANPVMNMELKGAPVIRRDVPQEPDPVVNMRPNPAPLVMHDVPQDPVTTQPNVQAGGAADVSGLNSQVTGLLSDLLNGKSPALDFAKRMTIQDAERGSREAVAAAGQRAASLGFAPGSPEYEKLIQDAKGQASSAGTQALAGVTKQGFDAQQNAINQSQTFGLGQQNYGLNALKNTQDQANKDRILNTSDEATKTKQLQDIIDNPTSSEAMIQWANGELGKRAGAPGAVTSSTNPSDPQNQLKYISEQLRVGHPEWNPQQLQAEALKYYNQLSDSARLGLIEAMKTTGIYGNQNPDGYSSSGQQINFNAGLGSSFLDPLSWYK